MLVFGDNRPKQSIQNESVTNMVIPSMYTRWRATIFFFISILLQRAENSTQREIRALDRQGTQQQRPESPTVTAFE